MIKLPDDIWELVEDYIDGQYDHQAWKMAQEEHGNILPEAIQQAQEQRTLISQAFVDSGTNDLPTELYDTLRESCLSVGPSSVGPSDKVVSQDRKPQLTVLPQDLAANVREDVRNDVKEDTIVAKGTTRPWAWLTPMAISAVLLIIWRVGSSLQQEDQSPSQDERSNIMSEQAISPGKDQGRDQGKDQGRDHGEDREKAQPHAPVISSAQIEFEQSVELVGESESKLFQSRDESFNSQLGLQSSIIKAETSEVLVAADTKVVSREIDTNTLIDGSQRDLTAGEFSSDVIAVDDRGDREDSDEMSDIVAALSQQEPQPTLNNNINLKAKDEALKLARHRQEESNIPMPSSDQLVVATRPAEPVIDVSVGESSDQDLVLFNKSPQSHPAPRSRDAGLSTTVEALDDYSYALVEGKREPPPMSEEHQLNEVDGGTRLQLARDMTDSDSGLSKNSNKKLSKRKENHLSRELAATQQVSGAEEPRSSKEGSSSTPIDEDELALLLDEAEGFNQVQRQRRGPKGGVAEITHPSKEILAEAFLRSQQRWRQAEPEVSGPSISLAVLLTISRTAQGVLIAEVQIENAGDTTLPSIKGLLPVLGFDAQAEIVWRADLPQPDHGFPLEPGSVVSWMVPLIGELTVPDSCIGISVLSGGALSQPAMVPPAP